MSKTTMMGLFGGAFIAIAVFILGTDFSFDAGEVYSSIAMIQLLAGVAIILCLLFKQRTWALYFTIAATTIMGIGLVDLFREDGPGLTLGFVVLFAGVVLALIGNAWPASKHHASDDASTP